MFAANARCMHRDSLSSTFVKATRKHIRIVQTFQNYKIPIFVNVNLNSLVSAASLVRIVAIYATKHNGFMVNTRLL